MNKWLFLILLFSFLNINQIKAEEQKIPTTLLVSLNQDPAYGFYPSFWGSFGLNEKFSLTTYGIFWTQEDLGDANGYNLLTEFGIGVNYTAFDGALNINPQLGFSHGNFQSGGGRGVIGDAIVPALYLTYSAADITTTLSGIYWMHLREEISVTPYMDLFEYSLNSMYSCNKYFSIGFTYDKFMFTTPKIKDSEKVTVYDWIGPTCRYSFNSGASVTASLGVDFSDWDNKTIADNDKKIKDFYRMSLTLPF